MTDIPFTWPIDLQWSRIRSFVGDHDDQHPYEPPSAIIKVSKLHLGSVNGAAWTLQFEHSKVYQQTFYGEEEKCVLILERDCHHGKVVVNGTIGIYDLGDRKCLTRTKVRHSFEDGQKLVHLAFDFPMCELSYSVFEDSEMCLQGNISIISVSEYISSNPLSTPAGISSSVETHILKYNPLEGLSVDLSSLLESGSFSDVAIRCGSLVLHAHKNILSARSPVFQAMFQAPMRENEENELVINDMEASILQKLMLYVYSGQVRDPTCNVMCDLLAAADKYQLTGLDTLCVDFLKCHLSTDNALKVLMVADIYNENLKSFVMQFVSAHFSDFENTADWISLVEEEPTLTIEVFHQVIKFLRKKP